MAASIRTLGTVVISAARQTLGCPDIRAAGPVDATGAKWFNAAHAGSPSSSSAALDLARPVRAARRWHRVPTHRPPSVRRARPGARRGHAGPRAGLGLLWRQDLGRA